MVKDLSFLTIKDDDSESIKAMKSYWQMVMAMPLPERRYFLQEERVKEEERYLQWMIDCNHNDDVDVEEFTHRARSAVVDYEMLHDEKVLDIAEAWTTLAQSTKANKFTIKDIRKQRERVQWEKKKLSQMTKPSTEQSQSSSH
jgi:hypothetical protein